MVGTGEGATVAIGAAAVGATVAGAAGLVGSATGAFVAAGATVAGIAVGAGVGVAAGAQLVMRITLTSSKTNHLVLSNLDILFSSKKKFGLGQKALNSDDILWYVMYLYCLKDPVIYIRDNNYIGLFNESQLEQAVNNKRRQSFLVWRRSITNQPEKIFQGWTISC